MDYSGLIAPAILAIMGSWLFSRPRRASAPTWTVESLTQQLDRLESLLLDEDLAHAAETLQQIEPPIMGIQGPGGDPLRARHHLAAGAFFARTSRPDAAKSRLRSALPIIEAIDDAPLAWELETMAEAELGLLASDSTAEPELIRSGRRALDREPRVERPEVLMRLVWVAHHLATIEHREGRWESARALLEGCVAISRRLEQPVVVAIAPTSEAEARERFWSWGRRVASEAARNLASVLLSLGDRERAMGWYDQAIALVEGATLPVARLRLAQALIDRAMSEPVDAFTGIGSHEALLERAVAVALSCKGSDGRTIACRAEAAWASLYPSLGMTEKAIEHLRSALALAGQMTEPAASGNLTYLHAQMAGALEASGDRAGALASLQLAVDRGRAHPDPDVRLGAVQAAYRQHQLLIQEARVSDARAAMEVIEQLVPNLVPNARSHFAVVAAHARGIQHLFEERHDEARGALEQAESLALQSDMPFIARAAATDLGRLALRVERPAEAEGHLRRALETHVPQEDPAQRQSRHAQIKSELAYSLVGLERVEEAMREWGGAYELGRNAGDASGREAAAVAAINLAGGAVEDGERRRYLEAAVRFGRLSGLARGREVADAAEARLREGEG